MKKLQQPIKYCGLNIKSTLLCVAVIFLAHEFANTEAVPLNSSIAMYMHFVASIFCCEQVHSILLMRWMSDTSARKCNIPTNANPNMHLKKQSTAMLP